MSHAIYQTPALILKTKNMRESNKLVFLYTKKFGLIYASMQSVRKLQSKMRYHIHPYSLVDVDLVSGRNIWRITGVHEKISAFDLIETPWYRITSLISGTLLRLCVGEEKNDMLWNSIMMFFENFNDKNSHYVSEYEVVIMVRMLHSLGYWNSNDIILQQENLYQKNIFEHIKKQRIYYIKQINASLYDSQL